MEKKKKQKKNKENSRKIDKDEPRTMMIIRTNANAPQKKNQTIESIIDKK